MKRHIGLYSALTVLAAALLLPAVFSCSGSRNAQVRQALAAADLLMLTQPQAALDTLMTIDSTDAGKLPRADKAFYTLLHTEAEYKCYLPVAENTAITEAADYYRRKGPEDRLARALVMQGAVLSEQGDTEGAMLAYKEAEPLLEHSGDPEQLGLLHTGIAELYQDNLLDASASASRYKKALECFHKAGLTEREMYTHLSLAKVLMHDSTDKAYGHLQKGLSMALNADNRICILSAYELLTYLYHSKGDHNHIIELANRVFRRFNHTSLNEAEESTYISILYDCAISYAETGCTDSAEIIAARIPIRDKYDSLYVLSLYAEIAEEKNEFEKALDYQKKINNITADILQESHDRLLADIEEKYENSRLREDVYRKERNNFILAFILSCTVIMTMTVYLIMKKLLRKQKAENERLTDIADTLNQTASQLTLELRAKDSTVQSVNRELTRYRTVLTQMSGEMERKKQQDESERKELELMLDRQARTNDRLLKYYASAYRVVQEIVTIYDMRSSNPQHFMEEALDVAKEFITDMNSFSNAKTVIDTAYPGFTDSILTEFPWLKDEDRHLIVLTCFGYPNSAAASLLQISEANLAVRRTRLARRMGLDESLTRYIQKKLRTYIDTAEEI